MITLTGYVNSPSAISDGVKRRLRGARLFRKIIIKRTGDHWFLSQADHRADVTLPSEIELVIVYMAGRLCVGQTSAERNQTGRLLSEVDL